MSRSIRIPALLPALAFMPLALACSSDGSNGGSGGSGGGASVTFGDVYSELRMGASCTGPACHTTSVGGNLIMTSPDMAYDNLVDQDAAGALCGDSGLKRVEPGNPEASLFYLKMIDPPPCGDPMPVAGSLDEAQVELVRTWIQSGAPRE